MGEWWEWVGSEKEWRWVDSGNGLRRVGGENGGGNAWVKMGG